VHKTSELTLGEGSAGLAGVLHRTHGEPTRQSKIDEHLQKKKKKRVKREGERGGEDREEKGEEEEEEGEEEEEEEGEEIYMCSCVCE